MYDIHSSQLFAEHSTSIEDVDRFIEALKQRVVNCCVLARLKKYDIVYLCVCLHVRLSTCTVYTRIQALRKASSLHVGYPLVFIFCAQFYLYESIFHISVGGVQEL